MNTPKQSNIMFWQLYASVYDLVNLLPPYKRMLYDIEQAAAIKQTDKVLDAGCGTGNFIYHMIKKHSKARFTGLDMSRSMLARAREKIIGNNVHFLLGNLNVKLPFPDSYFDCIVAINSLYATKDPRFTVSELIRVLKSGGRMIQVNPHSSAKFSTTYFKILNSGKGLKKIFLFLVTIPLFIFNMIIKIKANKQDYHFLASSDWRKLLEEHKVHSINIKSTYIESHLIKVVK